MASFDISYVIKALDKFSGPAAKIKSSMDAMSNKSRQLGESMRQTAKDSSLFQKGTALDKVMQSMAPFPRMMNTIGSAINNNTDRLVHSAHSFLKMTDKFAFDAFIQSMNVAMPLTLMFAKPLDDMMKTENAAATLQATLGKMNAKALISQIEKVSDATGVATADLQGAAKLLTFHGASAKLTKELLHPLAEMSTVMETSAPQLAEKFSKAIAQKSGKVDLGGGIIVDAIGMSNRAAQIIAEIKKKFGSTAEFINKHPANQVKKAFKNMGDAAGKFLAAAAPALTTLAKMMQTVAKVVSDFSEKHKTAAKWIGIVTVVAFGLVSAAVVLGAVLNIVAFGMVGLGLALKAVRFALLLTNGQLVITKLNMLAAKVEAVAFGAVQVAGAIKTGIFRAALIAWNITIRAFSIIMAVARGAMFAFNLVMTANPIGLVIVAVTALIGLMPLLFSHWKKITDFLKSVFSPIIDSVKEKLWDMLHPIEALKKGWASFKGWFSEHFGDKVESTKKAVIEKTSVNKSIAYGTHAVAHTVAQPALIQSAVNNKSSVTIDVKMHDKNNNVKTVESRSYHPATIVNVGAASMGMA